MQTLTFIKICVVELAPCYPKPGLTSITLNERKYAPNKNIHLLCDGHTHILHSTNHFITQTCDNIPIGEMELTFSIARVSIDSEYCINSRKSNLYEHTMATNSHFDVDSYTVDCFLHPS